MKLRAVLALSVLVVPMTASADPTDATDASPPQKDRLDELAARLDAQAKQIAAQQARLDAADEAAVASVAEVEHKEPKFRVYGFIDMGLQKLWTVDDPVVPTTKTTFVLGNVNLYFDFHPTEDWSSLVEVRLTNYPQGTEQYGIIGMSPYSRTNTTVYDPANGKGYDTIDIGAIILERAYIEWHGNEKLGVRVGQFLTPYGIWNVDHGSPTLITLYPPSYVTADMWPHSQLGVEAFGRLELLPQPWSLEYHAYVSNGRTPGVVALMEDKMVGGRLVASKTHGYPMAFGVSAMHGHYLDQEHDITLTGDTTRPATIDYLENGIAADASLDLGALRLRGEMLMRHRDYGTDKRETAWLPGVYVADGWQRDTYAIAAYRVPHTRFEPFVYLEDYFFPTPIGDDTYTASVGLNTYFTPAVQLKVQYSYTRVDDDADAAFIAEYPVFASSRVQHFLAGKLVMGF